MEAEKRTNYWLEKLYKVCKNSDQGAENSDKATETTSQAILSVLNSVNDNLTCNANEQANLAQTNPSSNSFVNNKLAQFIEQTNPNISGANLQEALNNLYNDLTNAQNSINNINNGDGSQLAYSYSEDFNDPKTSNTVKRALDRIITQVDGGLF